MKKPELSFLGEVEGMSFPGIQLETGMKAHAIGLDIESRIKALVTRMAKRSARGRDMYEHEYGTCDFCGKAHKIEVITTNGFTVCSCPNLKVEEAWHLPSIGTPEKHTVEVQTSVDDYDGEDDRDTDPPPPMPLGKRCYFCERPAVRPIYHGMPACEDCRRRAEGLGK